MLAYILKVFLSFLSIFYTEQVEETWFSLCQVTCSVTLPQGMFDVVPERGWWGKQLLNEKRNKSDAVMMKVCGLALGF